MFWRRKPTWLVLAVTLIVAMSSLACASRSKLLSRPIDDLLLEQHNIFRQEEKAANIFKMHWNESVAAAARDWASKCHFKHLLSGPYGENLFYSSDPSFEDFDIREILLEGLELWHDEKRGWTYSSSACGAACHYTQMVWSTTTSVGCANQMCHGLKVGRRSVDRALYLVCFYYPRGNWVGEYPFKRGRPCSDCGDGTCQDGLCVKERATFSSYHTRSENEVKSGSTWNWNYSARGQDSHHQASSFRNVSNVISRDPNQNGFRHTSSRHSQHNISVQTPLGHHHSRHTSSSVYRVSHNSHNQQQIELRERGLTYSSGGSLGRDFVSYNPSSSRLPSLAPAALRQAPRQAQYARPALERIGNNNNNNNNRREILADGRRSQSPLDVLRADTHWCRDRLPSCRIWTRDCLKSKAVYLACPRTCGHCGRNKDKEKPNALRDRPPPSPRSPSQPPSPHHRPAHQQVRVSQQHRQQQRSHPQHRAPQRQQQQQLQQQRPTPTSHRRLQPARQQQKQHHLRKHHRNNTVDRRRGRKNGTKRQQKRQPNGRRKANLQGRKRQGPKKGRGQGKRNGNGNGKRRNRPLGQRRKEARRQQRHKKFQNVDRRAQKLAKDLRMKALDGVRCEDDPKYTRSCPSWVRQGFCNGNVLVSDVYCKLSCQSC